MTVAIALAAFALGYLAAYKRGWNAHVDHAEAEGHAKVAAQAEKDRQEWHARWPWVVLAAFVVAMVVLGVWR